MRYGTIKDLVFDFVKKSEGKVDKDALAKEVLSHFPDSKWNDSHWGYYRNQIDHGRCKEEFDRFVKGEVRLVVSGDNSGRRGPRAESTQIKEHGDRILKQAREAIDQAAMGDLRLRGKINRWVFSRLLLDERLSKKDIKEAIWVAGEKKCTKCGKKFESIKGTELHRVNGGEWYSFDNCQLLCKPCHMSLGKKQ